jgi:heme exporter protein D
VTLPQLASLRALPLWAAYALALLALLISILGRHGARLTNGVLLGAAAFCASFFGLRGVGHEWLPGIAAIVLGGGLAVTGFAHLGAGTGLVCAAVAGTLGWFGAPRLHLEPEVPAAVAAMIGFCFGALNRRALALIVPPIVAAVFLAASLERLWAPAFSPMVKLSAACVFALALLIVSVERNHRARLRKEAGKKQDEERELRAKVSAQQAAFRRAQGGN